MHCPYLEFFWSVFSASVLMQENTDQKNSEYGHFSCSDELHFFISSYVQASTLKAESCQGVWSSKLVDCGLVFGKITYFCEEFNNSGFKIDIYDQ